MSGLDWTGLLSLNSLTIRSPQSGANNEKDHEDGDDDNDPDVDHHHHDDDHDVHLFEELVL